MSIADRLDAQRRRGVVTYTPMSDADKAARAQWGQSRLTSAQLGLSPTTGGETVEQMVAREVNSYTPPSPQNWLASLGLGGSSAANASDVFARRKYEDELAKERRQIEAYQNMLRGGGFRAGADRMLGMIGQEGVRSEGAVQDAYRRALENIAAGFETAQDLTTSGYGGLEQFLRANPNNPYANVQVSAGVAPDAMEQLLSAYGVSAEPVQAQVAAEQQAAQQAAAGFQNLLSTLGASAQQADLSRLAEMEMARTLAGQTLGAQRAGLQSQAEQGRAQALAQIQAQMAQARMEQEAGAIARQQGIEDLLGQLGATPVTPAGDGATRGAQTPIQMLAARADSAPPALQKRIEDFIAKNPNAGLKKIEKEFPRIAAALRG